MKNPKTFRGRLARSLPARSLLAAPLLVLAALAPGLAGAAPGGWQQVVPGASIVGVDGNTYAPSCSGFPGTDPTFSFWHKKSATGSRRTMVYFEGGGACWDNLTCSFPFGTGLPYQFFVPQVPPGTDPALFGGVFKDDPANPVRDWNMVYIPYCSGDIHTGSATQTYLNVGNPLLPIGTPITIQHRGFDNFMAVLAWMNESRSKPQQILVTGSSAGGYGATANFAWLAETFKSARVSLLADASQGVTTTAFDTGVPGRNSWNPQLPPWIYGPPPSAVRGGDLIRVLADAYPQHKFAQFTTPLDAVQIGFYGLMKAYYGPGGSCPDAAADWNQQMLADLALYRSGTPNYRYYVADGSFHTIMTDAAFYTDTTAGPTTAAWLGRMLKNQGGTGGAGGGWKNVACPTCLTPLPCP